MATAETVELNEAHGPKEESIKAFKEIELELKKELVHLRHDHDKHEKEYFQAVSQLSDQELAGFSSDDLKEVRVGTTAYGIHIFGKVRIPALDESGPAYIHIRIFDAGKGEEAKLHSIHTEEKPDPKGGFTYRAIFTKEDPLEWFTT